MLAVATVRTMDDKKQEKADRFLSHVHGAYKFDEETGETVKLQPVRARSQSALPRVRALSLLPSRKLG